MNERIKEHTNKQSFINEIKVIADNGLRDNKTIEEIKEEISNLCSKCLLPATEGCEICNGTEYNNQLYLNFEEETEE